jgi:phenylpropionate dioxygenase-like ring-hydroxylating dioxygenase large terminal subunit
MSIVERAATNVLGPVLSDGTALADLIDVERKVASLRLFSDPEVYRAEQQWLFGRTWNIVGHESEIPEPGDFIMRHIAEDSVIVTRGREGQISVMLNVCTHRGMQVCRSEAGNANNFKCPYHGWVFGTEGNLLGAPFEREMYGNDLDKPNLGLKQARVGLYAGIIYANWDHTAPPLDDFLGEYAWYLDTIFKRTNNGLECIGAPQRFQVQANWKTASEQFNGADGYHAATLHRANYELRTPGDDVAINQGIALTMFGIDIGSPMGHGLRAIDVRSLAQSGRIDGLDETKFGTLDAWEFLQQTPPNGLPPELVPELEQNLTDGQLRAMASYAPFPGGMFPNVGFLGANLRVHVPSGVDSFEMINFIFVEKDAKPEFKDMIRQRNLLQFGSSGITEQDDSESWPSIQKSATGYQGTQQVMRYQAFVGHNPPSDWEGGAYVYKGFSKDDSAWNWWLRYRDYFTGRPL